MHLSMYMHTHWTKQYISLCLFFPNLKDSNDDNDDDSDKIQYKCDHYTFFKISYKSIILFQGEPGQNAMKGPFASANDAVKDFEKKFTDKTKNKWANRDTFKSIPGKYTLIEMAGEDDAGEDTVDAVWSTHIF